MPNAGLILLLIPVALVLVKLTVVAAILVKRVFGGPGQKEKKRRLSLKRLLDHLRSFNTMPKTLMTSARSIFNRVRTWLRFPYDAVALEAAIRAIYPDEEVARLYLNGVLDGYADAFANGVHSWQHESAYKMGRWDGQSLHWRTIHLGEIPTFWHPVDQNRRGLIHPTEGLSYEAIVERGGDPYGWFWLLKCPQCGHPFIHDGEHDDIFPDLTNLAALTSLASDEDVYPCLECGHALAAREIWAAMNPRGPYREWLLTAADIERHQLSWLLKSI